MAAQSLICGLACAIAMLFCPHGHVTTIASMEGSTSLTSSFYFG